MHGKEGGGCSQDVYMLWLCFRGWILYTKYATLPLPQPFVSLDCSVAFTLHSEYVFFLHIPLTVYLSDAQHPFCMGVFVGYFLPCVYSDEFSHSYQLAYVLLVAHRRTSSAEQVIYLFIETIILITFLSIIKDYKYIVFSAINDTIICASCGTLNNGEKLSIVVRIFYESTCPC